MYKRVDGLPLNIKGSKIFKGHQFSFTKAGRIIFNLKKMLHTKFMLFAVAALMIVGSAVAIIGGKDAARGQFSYFVYLEVYKIPKPVISLYIYICY